MRNVLRVLVSVTLASLLVAVATRTAAAQSPCAVRGVWVMESATVDGKAEDLSKKRSQKIVTASHFAFVTDGSDNGYGGGSYTVSGNTYTEHLDYFYKAEYRNRDLPATCRIVAGKWHHIFEWPVIENGKETRRLKIEEVWRKIE